MKNYVLGFAFSEGLSQVLLIQKQRPVWQFGFANGIGGHIEPTDVAPIEAMVREFKEETGLHTRVSDWTQFADMGIDGLWKVSCFVATGIDVDEAKTMTDEKVVVAYVGALGNYRPISNLQWLIPMALDFVKSRQDFYTTIKYQP